MSELEPETFLKIATQKFPIVKIFFTKFLIICEGFSQIYLVVSKELVIQEILNIGYKQEYRRQLPNVVW